MNHAKFGRIWRSLSNTLTACGIMVSVIMRLARPVESMQNFPLAAPGV